MRIDEHQSIALMIDMQERLVPVMHESAALVGRVRLLIEGLTILGIPFLASEQYPKGLGRTLPELVQGIEGFVPAEKLSFSCCDDPGLMKTLEERAGAVALIGFGSQSGMGADGRGKRRNTIIVFGVEAHVCVLQTVVDLKAKGFVPVLVSDCIASRSPVDRAVAVERMRDEGAIVTTSESLLFELCRTAGTERFKAISKLVK